MNSDFTFFSRSVTEGHPDKLCDQISDALVGLYLRQDPYSRVAAECAVSNGILFIAVRFSSRAALDIAQTARGVVGDVGYDAPEFNPRTCTVMTSISEFPPDKGTGQAEKELSAEDLDEVRVLDQATVFGYACRHSPGLMPLPVWLARKLARRLDVVRKEDLLSYLAPEGKTQVGVDLRNRRPQRIYSVNLIASQQSAGFPSLEKLRKDLREAVVEPAFEDEEFRPDGKTAVDINVAGPVIKGGPMVHSGLTGRKTAEDTYGEYARHSQTALSGKDPSRIGRAGGYAARHAAKNVVASGLAEECEVQLSYSLGAAGPISVQADTYGTGKIPDAELIDRMQRVFDFRLAAIVRRFNLRYLPSQHPDGFYRKLAVYGHVGREDLDLPWEATDRADALLE